MHAACDRNDIVKGREEIKGGAEMRIIFTTIAMIEVNGRRRGIKLRARSRSVRAHRSRLAVTVFWLKRKTFFKSINSLNAILLTYRRSS